MTYEEASSLKTFKNYCNCGGAHGIAERSRSRNPHMQWCPQLEEWEEWKSAMESGEKEMS